MLFYVLLISYAFIATSLYAIVIHREGVFLTWSDWALETLMILFFPVLVTMFVIWFIFNFMEAGFNIMAHLIRKKLHNWFPKKVDSSND